MKKTLSFLMMFCLSVPLFFVLLHVEGVPAVKETYLSGHITEDTLFPAGIYIVTGTVTADAGVRVEFQAGADVRFSNTYHAFYVYGTLILNGTRQNPVYFRHESLEPTPGGYQGIYFMPSSSGEISHAVITDAVVGVNIRGSNIKVRDSEIAFCSDSGVKVDVSTRIPRPTFTYGTEITDTRIRNCTVGIKDNGVGTLVKDCVIRDNTEYGIYLGHDHQFPQAPSAKIKSNILQGNGYRYPVWGQDLFINATDDPADFRDLEISDNGFYETNPRSIEGVGVLEGLLFERNYFRGIRSMTGIYLDGLKEGRIIFNVFGNGSGITITNFKDLTVEGNNCWGINGGINVGNGENLSFANNTYRQGLYSQSGGAFYQFQIRNVTNASVVGNEVYNFSHDRGAIAINVALSSPVRIYDNRVEGCQRTGIAVVGAGIKDVKGDVGIVNNTVVDCESGLGLSEMGERTYVSGLKAVNCTNSIYMNLGSGFVSLEKVDVWIEESTLINDRYSLYLDRSGGREMCTVQMRNTTYNPLEVYGRAYNTVVEVVQHLKVRAYDDLGRPTSAHLKITNVSGSKIYEQDIVGASPIIEGPPLRYLFDQRTYYRLPSVNFTDVNLIYEATGRGTVQGALNLTRYTELDLFIDGRPLYQGPSVVSFPEDLYLLLDPYEWFIDLDPVVCEVMGAGSNLTVNGFNITSAEEDWYGESWILIRATDSWGNYTEVNLTVVVLPMEDPPEITPPLDEIFMDEDTSYTLNLSSHMYDADGDILSWRVEPGENLTLTLEEESWELHITPVKDFYGEELVRLYLSDGEVEVPTILKVHVNPVNDPPVFSPPENWNVTLERGVEKMLDLADYVTDVDSPELTFTADSDYAAVVGSTLVILVPTTTTISLFNIRITVYDGEGGNDSAVLVVRVAVHWNISSASVTVDENGNWKVEVRGEGRLTVYIVIEGVGSFLLEETEEGVYSGEIPGERFEQGKTYGYHFSDREGGEDMAPHLSSSVKQPEKKKEVKEGTWAYLAILLLLALLLISVILLLQRKKGGSGEVEE